MLAFNEAGVKLHKKFGFNVEGTFRDQHKISDEYVDVIRLGVVKSEWELVREDMLKKLSYQR